MTTAEASAAALDILSDLAPRRRPNTTCDITEMRRERPDLADQYDRAMAANRYSDRAIADWVTDHGYPLGRMTVTRHRTGQCVTCRTTS